MPRRSFATVVLCERMVDTKTSNVGMPRAQSSMGYRPSRTLIVRTNARRSTGAEGRPQAKTWASSADERADHREHVPRPSPQPAREVGEPRRPVRNVFGHAEAPPDELRFERVPYALEHLELEWRIVDARQLEGPLDH